MPAWTLRSSTSLDIASRRELTIFWLKISVFAAALIPFTRLAYAALFDVELLGPNPAEMLTRSLGDWALRFLLMTLAITPLRRLTGRNALLRFRRMLGLFSFFYVLLHVSSYVTFDQVFNVADIIKDIGKRPFITVGFATLVLITPLAVTSTNAMVRRLGARRWQALHRLIYVIGPLAVLHFWWMVKRDITQPAIYGVILAILLGYRMIKRRSRSQGRAQPARA